MRATAEQPLRSGLQLRVPTPYTPAERIAVDPRELAAIGISLWARTHISPACIASISERFASVEIVSRRPDLAARERPADI